MLRKIIHFIKYHNALPIAFSVILLGSGAALAASPQVQEIVISEETIIRSVDNSYIVSINLDTHNPQLQIISIEEDDSFYYVSYTYDTISIDNYVWKEININETLAVSKGALGSRDLGLYIAEEISEVVQAKSDYLKRVQEIEQHKGITKKIATTKYSGLVGRFFSQTEEEFEGYVPLIPEERPVVNTVAEGQVSAQIVTSNDLSAQVAAAMPSKEEIKQIIQDTVKALLAEGSITTTVVTTDTTTSSNTTDTTPPSITISGNNPATISVDSSYVDLGATVEDNVDNNLGITLTLNGTSVTTISIDTSTDATHSIIYSATDQAGNTGTAERIVIVGTGETSTTTEETTTTETIDTTTETTTTETTTTETTTTETTTDVAAEETTATATDTDTATSTPETLDTTPPTITLTGEATVLVEHNTTYTDQGATASDDTDGDLTSQIITINPVDTTTLGDYTITYNVTDEAGNSATEVTRTISVVEGSI